MLWEEVAAAYEEMEGPDAGSTLSARCDLEWAMRKTGDALGAKVAYEDVLPRLIEVADIGDEFVQ